MKRAGESSSHKSRRKNKNKRSRRSPSLSTPPDRQPSNQLLQTFIAARKTLLTAEHDLEEKKNAYFRSHSRDRGVHLTPYQLADQRFTEANDEIFKITEELYVRRGVTVRSTEEVDAVKVLADKYDFGGKMKIIDSDEDLKSYAMIVAPEKMIKFVKRHPARASTGIFL
ncbi:hypothetical protein OROMI_019041 [Orobanche minor]